MEEKMYRISLDEQQFDLLRQERFSYPDPRVCKKIETILLVSQNIPHQSICKIIGISRTTLSSYIKQFQQGGLEALKENHYVSPISPLKEHTATLERYFNDHPPRSVNEAIHLIETLTGLKYKKSFVHQFLTSLGFRFRKTGGVPAGADIPQQEDFKKNA
jgi:transposase